MPDILSVVTRLSPIEEFAKNLHLGSELDFVPKISVLMTVYDAETYLQESIRSILNQDFTDWELIVIENGSRDGSGRILRSISDRRIKPTYLTENIGRTEALNLALAKSNSKYIAILDADDVSMINRFTKQYEKLESDESIGLVGSWTQFIDSEGQNLHVKIGPELHDEIVRLFATRNPFVHSSVMFRRSVAIAIGGYDTSYKYAQDFDLILKIASLARVEIIPEILCAWRSIKSSQTNSPGSSVVRARDEYQLFRRIRLFHNLNKVSRLANYKQIFITRLIYSKTLAQSGKWVEALKIAVLG
jgi:glycosyltransferase involved in cell wall biosynthesis